jgi:hypothetical protein
VIVGERCAGCGAKTQDAAGACVYCGTLAHAEAPPADDRRSQRLERFDGLADHPKFDHWMRWRPAQEGGATAPPGRVVALFVVFVCAALLLSIDLADAMLLPVVVVAAAGGALIFAWRQKRAAEAAQDAEVVAYPALVVAKRADVSGGPGGTGTRYFLTLEYRSGRRAEYEVDGAFHGLVAEDDLGVAYVREDELVTFKNISA